MQKAKQVQKPHRIKGLNLGLDRPRPRFGRRFKLHENRHPHHIFIATLSPKPDLRFALISILSRDQIFCLLLFAFVCFLLAMFYECSRTMRTEKKNKAKRNAEKKEPKRSQTQRKCSKAQIAKKKQKEKKNKENAIELCEQQKK